MKTIQFFCFTCIVLLCGSINAHAQESSTTHPLYPFSKYSGDTVAYLTKNFDAGADNIYYEQPLAKFFQNMDPAMPIRTFYPIYYTTSKIELITGFFCFPYTKEQLKHLVKKGKPIYGIGLLVNDDIGGMMDGSISNDSELFKYIRNMGLGKILPWTSEFQQKIGHLSFKQGMAQEVTPTVKRYLEYHP